MIFTSVIFRPIAAGVGAALAGAGWLPIFFMPVGLAVDIGIFDLAGHLSMPLLTSA